MKPKNPKPRTLEERIESWEWGKLPDSFAWLKLPVYVIAVPLYTLFVLIPTLIVEALVRIWKGNAT